MLRRKFVKYALGGLSAMSLTNNLFALKFYPKSSDKRIAVLYSTWCGSSRDAAVWISEGMGGIADVFDIREKPDLAPISRIIIGGSIRYGETSKELQNYIKENMKWLRGKVCGLFVVCGNMRRPISEEQRVKFIDNHLAKLCEVGNVPSRVFNGRVTKCLLEPEAAKLLAHMEDYDDLKRSDCLEFGREILSSLKD